MVLASGRARKRDHIRLSPHTPGWKIHKLWVWLRRNLILFLKITQGSDPGQTSQRMT